MGRYLDVHGQPTWVQDDGTDAPALLMLHGGFLGSDSSWGGLPPLLSARYRLVMFDRRGHGRTGDTADAFHYSSMAEEAGAVIERLELSPVNALGYSDGANALLHLARTRPELLRAIVLVSANFHHDALDAGTLDHVGGAVDAPDGALAQLYAAVSPDGPDHWPVVARKGMHMVRTEPTFAAGELSVIATPTLVLASDDDLFPLAHTVALHEALPNAQLAVVPNTSHALVLERPALVAQLVDEFLGSPEPASTMLPNRRVPFSAESRVD